MSAREESMSAREECMSARGAGLGAREACQIAREAGSSRGGQSARERWGTKNLHNGIRQKPPSKVVLFEMEELA